MPVVCVKVCAGRRIIGRVSAAAAVPIKTIHTPTHLYSREMQNLTAGSLASPTRLNTGRRVRKEIKGKRRNKKKKKVT